MTIETTLSINPVTGLLDKIIDPASIIIPDGIPAPWDASGGIFPTVVVWTPDRWIISVWGTLPGIGFVEPWDAIIYDGSTWTVIHGMSRLVTNSTVISNITDPANWNDTIYTGDITGLIEGNYYYDSIYHYQFDGTTLYRVNTGPHREFSGAPTADNDSVDTAGIGWKFNPWYVWLDINTFPVTPYICLDSTPTAAVRSKMMMGWEDGYILQSSDGTRHSITLIDDGAGNYNLDIWPTI
jgi:hypothetical protein